MKYKIYFSKISNMDLENIIEYYFELNRRTAKKYYDGILILIKKLTKFPFLGRIVPEFEAFFGDKYRELIYEYFRIVYRVEKDQIIILRIIDGRKLFDLNILKEIY